MRRVLSSGHWGGGGVLLLLDAFPVPQVVFCFSRGVYRLGPILSIDLSPHPCMMHPLLDQSIPPNLLFCMYPSPTIPTPAAAVRKLLSTHSVLLSEGRELRHSC